jgi:hypothetical protein
VSTVFLAALVVRRIHLERRERLRHVSAGRLRPVALALALVEGEDVAMPELDPGEERNFGARRASGSPRTSRRAAR